MLTSMLSVSFVFVSLCLFVSHGEPTYKHYHRIHNESFQKPWVALESVDGLKNTNIVLLISGTSFDSFRFLRESQRTWMKLFANAFVIVEDNFQTRYAFRHCNVRETPHFTSFDCRNEPTYVLSRKCLPTKGGGPGPCCKVDELFTYLMVDRPDVYSHIKWAIHGDDDNFIRVDQLMMFFAKLNNIGLSTVPIVGNGNMGEYKNHVYNTKGCEEIHTYGWYQPLFINRAAMELMKVGFSSYGVQETCVNFHVTHDVGLGPFLWMYGAYHLRVPGVLVTNHDVYTGSIVTHKVVHDRVRDSCNNITNFSESQRYNQKILLGCGDVDEIQGKHKAGEPDYSPSKSLMYNDNYELWNHFKEHGEDASWGLHGRVTWQNFNVTLHPNGTTELISGSLPGEENTLRIKHILNATTDVVEADGTFKGDHVRELYLPILYKLSGYETTQHSRQYDIVKQWVGFKPEFCAPVTAAGTAAGK